MATNPLIEAINNIFTQVLTGIGSLLTGPVGYVIMGFLTLGFTVALVKVAKKIWNSSEKSA